MFVKAIERASGFLRPVHAVFRYYNEADVRKMALNIVFVNEYGVAITARHVAEHLEQLTGAHDRYQSFLREKAKLRFFDCFTEPCPRYRVLNHSQHDLSIIIFENYGKRLYKSYARFVRDNFTLKPGLSVCKLGFINPQFTNYTYDRGKDEIEWTGYTDRAPVFYPVEGIITRNLIRGYYVYGLEISTPGLCGQSGGPLPA